MTSPPGQCNGSWGSALSGETRPPTRADSDARPGRPAPRNSARAVQGGPTITPMVAARKISPSQKGTSAEPCQSTPALIQCGPKSTAVRTATATCGARSFGSWSIATAGPTTTPVARRTLGIRRVSMSIRRIFATRPARTKTLASSTGSEPRMSIVREDISIAEYLSRSPLRGTWGKRLAARYQHR